MLISRSFKPVVLAAALMAAALVAGCDRQSGDAAQQADAGTGAPVQPGTIDRSHKGSRMPDLSFADPQGKTLRLGELAGQPVLLNLWATWCAPCIAELPALNTLAATGKVRVVTVSQDMQVEKVPDFLRQRGGERLEAWLDPENALSFHYATGTLPTTVLYDAQGREVWRMVGEHDWTGADTAALLAEAGA